MRIFARRVTAVVLCFFVMLTSVSFSASAAAKTGPGMAEWALRAYNEGWKYVFGAEEVGAVDCSGLIRSYINGGGGAKALLNASQESGYMDTMPNVHGLGLWCDGHAGVYVGKASDGTNMAVDARNSRVNVVYSTMDSRSWNPWVKWFKVQSVEYPTTGWETFNGDTYYYYNGEFVTGIFTVDGVTYDFGKSGTLIGVAKPTTTTTTTTAANTTTSTRVTTTTTAPTSLKKGMSGEEVKAVQKRLIELGFMTAKATGYYGKKTEEAVKKFQEAAGLTADGIVGSGTKAKLFSDNAPRLTTAAKTTTTTAKPSLKQGMSGSEVTAMQKRLIELGYMTAKATGYFGKQTERALKAFQQAVGLTPDGVFGQETKDKLFASDAPKLTTTTATTATTTTTAAVTTTTTATTTPITASSSTAADSGAVTTTTPVSDPAVTTTTTTTAPPTPIEMLLSGGVDYSDQYVDLEFGTTGDVVIQLQQRLSELGYYDGNIDGYYGVFLRIAVTQFQENSGISGSGIADINTQALLYSDYAPYADGTVSYLMDYDEEDYMIDEGDYYEEPEESQPLLALQTSNGLSGYSTEADISSFARRFGSGGALQTLGVAESSEPIIIIVYDGDSFELTEELQGIIDDCVFF